MAPLIHPKTRAAILGYSGNAWFQVEREALSGHLVVVGDTGSGKTTLLKRLALASVAQGEGLTIVMDCKGGPGARYEGQEWMDEAVGFGADPARCMVWPYTGALNMWQMEAEDLIETLTQMVESGGNAHYDELRKLAVRIAVKASVTPPDAKQFLKRLDAKWLDDALDRDSPHRPSMEYLTSRGGSSIPPIWDIRAKYTGLFEELGGDLENGRTLDDIDLLWCSVAGTRRAEVAKAQANAIVQMVIDALAKDKAGERPITLIVDEFSAVSAGVDLSKVVERLRSLGGRVIVAAQSWEGLGPSDGARARLVAACSGGLMMMRTCHPSPFARFMGTQGFSAFPLVEGSEIRRQQVGEVAYVRNGRVTRGEIERRHGMTKRDIEMLQPKVPGPYTIGADLERWERWAAVAQKWNAAQWDVKQMVTVSRPSPWRGRRGNPGRVFSKRGDETGT